MSNYVKGLETQQIIIEAAKKLFYQKGYEETTFSDICNITGVNRGLITYHFKTKAALANLVFQHYINDSMEQCSKLLAKEEKMTQYFVSDYIYFKLIFRDERFRNFMNTCCRNGFLQKEIKPSNIKYMRTYSELIEIITSEAAADDSLFAGLLVAYEGLKSNYTCHVCENIDTLTDIIATENYIYIYSQMLSIPKKKYGEMMMRARILADQFNFSIENFDFRIEK